MTMEGRGAQELAVSEVIRKFDLHWIQFLLMSFQNGLGRGAVGPCIGVSEGSRPAASSLSPLHRPPPPPEDKINGTWDKLPASRVRDKDLLRCFPGTSVKYTLAPDRSCFKAELMVCLLRHRVPQSSVWVISFRTPSEGQDPEGGIGQAEKP